MSDWRIHVVPDTEVIRHVLQDPGRFAAFVGAGASREARVFTANEISNDVLDRLHEANPDRDLADLRVELKWDDIRRRYSTCLLRFGGEAQRVLYFRKLLQDKEPAFCHHATALLMREGILKSTCLTTNFDKLIEVAFAQQGYECQAIRLNDEVPFWRIAEPGRYYVLKLHGDYDTHNILNTRDETLRIDPDLKLIATTLLTDAGVIVLGAGGFEESVIDLFNELTGPRVVNAGHGRVPLGLYWGVFVGGTRPERISALEMKGAVEKSIQDGAVSIEVLEMMRRANTESRPCAFFPVWGAGGFLFRLIRATLKPEEPHRRRPRLNAAANLYLDHEMRLQNVFSATAGLSAAAIEIHLKKLADERKRLQTRENEHIASETVCTAKRTATGSEIRVVYGDITSRALMATEPGRRAVLSPEDTYISAGGGVAFSLLLKAGKRTILNELAKLMPIEQGEVAVTSGGELPVQYIIHGAALKIQKDASYSVEPKHVRRTIDSALRCAAALGVTTLFVPLIAAGVGPLTPLESFEAITGAFSEWAKTAPALTLIVVIFKESQLPRARVLSSLKRTLPRQFRVAPPDGSPAKRRRRRT
jgi:O-acetyl-ADP-ribose deacetylase (regulator of RNase III)